MFGDYIQTLKVANIAEEKHTKVIVSMASREEKKKGRKSALIINPKLSQSDPPHTSPTPMTLQQKIKTWSNPRPSDNSEIH